MKKFISIIAVVIIIAALFVGATACGGDAEKSALIGTWFGQEQVEEGKTGRVYFTVISENAKYKNALDYKQYGIYPSQSVNNNRVMGYYDDFPLTTVSVIRGQLSCKFRANNVVENWYKVTLIDDDNYTVTRWDGKVEGTGWSGTDYSTYVFTRTTMTLEEFRETYGQYTIER